MGSRMKVEIASERSRVRLLPKSLQDSADQSADPKYADPKYADPKYARKEQQHVDTLHFVTPPA